MNNQTRFTLSESDIPKRWYNIAADSPVPPTPVFNPVTLELATPEFLSALFPMPIIEQEMCPDRYVDIPEEVREAYKLYRPTPLVRAVRLEKALGTPAHIYYKYEGASPTGSHKANSAIAQAYYNKKAGTRAMTTETGAGQWGSALSMACAMFDLPLEVYMVRCSYDQKPYRRILMETYGAQVYASPTDQTESGRGLLAQDPNHPGSLGAAISEACEAAAVSNGAKKYGLGSVLNHVILHQTVIGEEALLQMDMAGEYPDVVIGCVGGGSNFSGIAFPFLRQNLKDGQRTRLVAVEPTAAPSLTQGVYDFDYGDATKLGPIAKMYTLGHAFIPPSIHAGGLRYHGMAPQLCSLYDAGLIEAVAVPQLSTFEAALLFTRTEGLLPAPESAHAIRGAIDEALDAKVKGEKRIILFNLSGHGNFDLGAYEDYKCNRLDNAVVDFDRDEIRSQLPQVSVMA
jgi:tryptophan synthase beta chain